VKFALGTVQFGLPYGIANNAGQVSREEAVRILAFARDRGIDTIDTAIAYGDSELRLGMAGMEGFKVVTKLPAVPESDDNIESWVHQQVQASLHRLRVDSVYGLLLHRSQNLLGASGPSLVRALERLKTGGTVRKIGVSIYDPNELGAVTQVCAIDLVQAPLNLIDRRMITSGWLRRLHDDGIEVHTRSVFLQGLLLIPRQRIPQKFSQWSALFDLWDAWLIDNRVAAIEACLAFVKHPLIDRVVVGVDSLSQLSEILRAADRPLLEQLPEICCGNENLINPSNWNAL